MEFNAIKCLLYSSWRKIKIDIIQSDISPEILSQSYRI